MDSHKSVNLVIVGAGPATFGLIINALRNNKLKDLLTKDGGIAILDQGEAFGGGALQHFGINSNTSANGFIKFVYNKNNSKHHHSDDDDAIDSERDEPAEDKKLKDHPSVLNCFKELVTQPLFKKLQS